MKAKNKAKTTDPPEDLVTLGSAVTNPAGESKEKVCSVISINILRISDNTKSCFQVCIHPPPLYHIYADCCYQVWHN